MKKRKKSLDHRLLYYQKSLDKQKILNLNKKQVLNKQEKRNE